MRPILEAIHPRPAIPKHRPLILQILARGWRETCPKICKNPNDWQQARRKSPRLVSEGAQVLDTRPYTGPDVTVKA